MATMSVTHTLTNPLNSLGYLLLHEQDSKQKKAFIQALMDRLNPPPASKLLHAGCGTGLYTTEMARAQMDVTGVDFSAEAISKAEELEAENMHFYLHDVRLPFWMNYFDYIFSLFTSFGYYRSFREHDNAIRVLAQSLKIGGTVVVDYLNVHYDEDNLVAEQTHQVKGVTYTITNTQDEERFTRKLDIMDGDCVEESFIQTYYKFSIGDFTDMFAYQGLQIQEVYGNYNFELFDIYKSPRLIFLAKKIRY